MPAKLLHMRMPIDADADAVLLLSPDVAVVPATSPFPSRPAGAEALQYSLVLACSATRLRGAPRSTRATAHASLSRTLLLHGRVRACLSLPLAGRAGVPAVPTAARHATRRRRRRHRVRPASEKGAGRGLRFLQSCREGLPRRQVFQSCFRFQRFLICFFILFYRDASVSFVVRARQSPPARGEESGRRAPPPPQPGGGRQRHTRRAGARHRGPHLVTGDFPCGEGG